MARAYSGVLGAIAVSFLIVRGLLCGSHPDDILKQCLVMFPLFAAVGFFIGFTAKRTIRESVENRFRSEMASLQEAAANKHSGSSE
ncbi:MAG: hypothetical protein Aurels2KO_23880 [Aureliella sp.]